MDKEEQSRHVQHGYEAAIQKKNKDLWNLVLELKNKVLERDEKIKELEAQVKELSTPLWPV